MTSTSKRANSPRIASAIPTSANLLAEYSGHAGIPFRPHMEATFTTAGIALRVVGEVRERRALGAAAKSNARTKLDIDASDFTVRF